LRCAIRRHVDHANGVSELARAPRDFPAIWPGAEPNIRDEGVEGVGVSVQSVERVVAVVNDLDLVPRVEQDVFNWKREQDVVFDYQHSQWNVLSISVGRMQV
jgi:hypothetical protein